MLASLEFNMAAILEYGGHFFKNQTSNDLGNSQFGILSIKNMCIVTSVNLLRCLKFKLWSKVC